MWKFDLHVGHRADVIVITEQTNHGGTIAEYFTSHGFEATCTSCLRDGLRRLSATAPNLLILDLKVGQQEGYEALRFVRSKSMAPVIIITDPGADEIDRVMGLELGADDCVAGTVGLRELVARARAVLRRRMSASSRSDRGRRRGWYHFHGWVLNHRGRSLTSPAGTPVRLSKGEFALLSAFVDAPGEPLSREKLLQATRMHEDIFDRSVDVQILRLRRKLEEDPCSPALIRTARGVGYVFTAHVEHVPRPARAIAVGPTAESGSRLSAGLPS
ncbi:MAG: winged helix-turn-helix domain-containing protein [Inquilinus sp.]|uniref:winged helix-turn-helix domain-containing protein n=1 Tax=Inquilinus sp. TaxID=1932117 RepID=UPI003F33DFEC